MPHESTVGHEQTFVIEEPGLRTMSRDASAEAIDGAQRMNRSNSLVPHLRPDPPTLVTHHHDTDDEEEDSDKSA